MTTAQHLDAVDMYADILELLARAHVYDEKPHLLYSLVRQLALKYKGADEKYRDEIVRLMDIEYERDRSKT